MTTDFEQKRKQMNTGIEALSTKLRNKDKSCKSASKRSMIQKLQR